ncbi:recombinase RecT [Marinobacter sp. OP 3.4]|uniref:recombinase RecT n=1 Tax=Marinobacter sp. OP 3.4 TaxID=3076501 RepID=UPI002E216F20
MSNAIAKTTGMGFALQPNSMDEAFRMAEMLAGSQMVPKNYQGKPQDALVAMMMGSELGLNPIQSLANVAVINGKPAIYGDALLALVQNHPKFGGHEEFCDEATMTATCTVWRKGDAAKHTVTFSQADAQKAGLWGKSGPWTQYPKRMLMWRARGYALRDKFADALGGLITVEEARDIPEQDMGPAQRYEAPKDAARPALEHYPADSFEQNFPKWQQIVESGKKSANDIVAMLESKAVLTPEQRDQILALEEGAEA